MRCKARASSTEYCQLEKGPRIGNATAIDAPMTAPTDSNCYQMLHLCNTSLRSFQRASRPFHQMAPQIVIFVASPFSIEDWQYSPWWWPHTNWVELKALHTCHVGEMYCATCSLIIRFFNCLKLCLTRDGQRYDSTSGTTRAHNQTKHDATATNQHFLLKFRINGLLLRIAIQVGFHVWIVR